ncbi:MAG: DUF935 family protein, partial [Armatimonadota bacterium]
MKKYFSALKDKVSFRSPPLNETASALSSNGNLLRDIMLYPDDDLINMKGFEIYDKMQTDAQVHACLSIKKFSVLSRGWKIHPASESQQDREVAEFVKFALMHIKGSVIDVLYNALDAIAKGYSIMEINYSLLDNPPYKGMVAISNIKSKNPVGFAFDTDEYLNIKNIISLPDRKKLNPEKFVIYSYMPKY